MTSWPKQIAVIGLGYVGLPLAVALARHFRVIGFDVDRQRVEDLESGLDRTREIAAEDLRSSTLGVTADEADLAGSELFLVTVPTPVDASKMPDLSLVKEASRTVGRHLSSGAVVVYECTFYPGVTEEICSPILAEASGLTCGKDFSLGYSPERINPGDREYTIDRIVKVVAGQTPEVTEKLAAVYGRITSGGVFRAASIMTAEAAKVIENAQRDINIAFINEVAMIFNRLDLSVYDVLDAARTKWNFLNFRPGLVGGHCIGVDPFYLVHRASELGYLSEVILAGRRINDSMGSYVARQVVDRLDNVGRVLILGLTFKENVPDLRNTKVLDLMASLRTAGHLPEVHDPIADPVEAKELYGIDVLTELENVSGYAAVVGAVAHDDYRGLSSADFERLLLPGGLVADVKGIWRDLELPDGVRRWTI